MPPATGIHNKHLRRLTTPWAQVGYCEVLNAQPAFTNGVMLGVNTVGGVGSVGTDNGNRNSAAAPSATGIEGAAPTTENNSATQPSVSFIYGGIFDNQSLSIERSSPLPLHMAEAVRRLMEEARTSGAAAGQRRRARRGFLLGEDLEEGGTTTSNSNKGSGSRKKGGASPLMDGPPPPPVWRCARQSAERIDAYLKNHRGDVRGQQLWIRELKQQSSSAAASSSSTTTATTNPNPFFTTHYIDMMTAQLEAKRQMMLTQNLRHTQQQQQQQRPAGMSKNPALRHLQRQQEQRAQMLARAKAAAAGGRGGDVGGASGGENNAPQPNQSSSTAASTSSPAPSLKETQQYLSLADREFLGTIARTFSHCNHLVKDTAPKMRALEEEISRAEEALEKCRREHEQQQQAQQNAEGSSAAEVSDGKSVAVEGTVQSSSAVPTDTAITTAASDLEGTIAKLTNRLGALQEAHDWATKTLKAVTSDGSSALWFTAYYRGGGDGNAGSDLGAAINGTSTTASKATVMTTTSPVRINVHSVGNSRAIRLKRELIATYLAANGVQLGEGAGGPPLVRTAWCSFVDTVNASSTTGGSHNPAINATSPSSTTITSHLPNHYPSVVSSGYFGRKEGSFGYGSLTSLTTIFRQRYLKGITVDHSPANKPESKRVNAAAKGLSTSRLHDVANGAVRDDFMVAEGLEILNPKASKTGGGSDRTSSNINYYGGSEPRTIRVDVPVLKLQPPSLVTRALGLIRYKMNTSLAPHDQIIVPTPPDEGTEAAGAPEATSADGIPLEDGEMLILCNRAVFEQEEGDAGGVVSFATDGATIDGVVEAALQNVARQIVVARSQEKQQQCHEQQHILSINAEAVAAAVCDVALDFEVRKSLQAMVVIGSPSKATGTPATAAASSATATSPTQPSLLADPFFTTSTATVAKDTTLTHRFGPSPIDAAQFQNDPLFRLAFLDDLERHGGGSGNNVSSGIHTMSSGSNTYYAPPRVTALDFVKMRWLTLQRLLGTGGGSGSATFSTTANATGAGASSVTHTGCAAYSTADQLLSSLYPQCGGYLRRGLQKELQFFDQGPPTGCAATYSMRREGVLVESNGCDDSGIRSDADASADSNTTTAEPVDATHSQQQQSHHIHHQQQRRTAARRMFETNDYFKSVASRIFGKSVIDRL